MQQHRRLHRGIHLAGRPYPFGGGFEGALPEPAPQDGRAPYVVALSGPDEIVLKAPPGGLARDSLRLDATAARRLAGDLLAFAGAIDGAPSD
jgi:hypothetical protein